MTMESMSGSEKEPHEGFYHPEDDDVVLSLMGLTSLTCDSRPPCFIFC